MKVKQVPDDFVVEEEARLRPSDRGPFALYRLRKQGVGTLEALRALRRVWKVPARAVGFGGLKDRHAVTTQWVTLPHGPRRNLEQATFRLTYEGQCGQPMSRMLLAGNRFGIRLRDLSPAEAATVADRLLALAAHGLPAYFDDQRFGSVRGGTPFAALLLLRGDVLGALRAVLATPTALDRGPVRKRRMAIAKAWGRFAEALPHAKGTPVYPALAHLAAHPDDPVGAFAALDREEKALLASAYQSAVWNRAVATRLLERLPERERLVLPSAAGPLVFPKDPAALADLAGSVVPLPAPSAQASDPGWQAALENALAGDGLTLAGLRLDPRLGLALRATKRPVLFRPEGLEVDAPVADDLNRGRVALDLRFSLRPGTYATLLLRRATYDLSSRPGAASLP